MRSGATQLSGGSPKIMVVCNGEIYYTEGSNSGFNERIISIATDEQVYGGQYTILLDNSDASLDAKDYKGRLCVIQWGFIESAGSNQGMLWVDTQDFISVEGKLVLQLNCIDAWGLLSQIKGTQYGSYWNYAWQSMTELDKLYLPETTDTPLPTDLKTKINSHYSQTIQTIVDTTMDAAFNSAIDIDWSDLAYDTALNHEKPVVNSNDPRSLIASVLSYSKSYLLWKADMKFYQRTPQSHADVYTYNNGTYHTQVTDEKTLVVPNRVCVWFLAKNPTDVSPTDPTIILATPSTWKWAYKVAVNAESYARLGYTIDEHINTEFDLLEDLTAAEAQTRADARMSQLTLSKATGTIVAPMNCAQELFDLVSVLDDRYTTPRTVTGYVFGIKRDYDRGKYQITVTLGGTVTGYTAPGSAPLNITQSPNAPSEPTVPIPVTAIQIPKGLQEFTHNLTFTSSGQVAVAWSSGTVKFVDGTSQVVYSGSTVAIPGHVTYIWLDMADPSPFTLKTIIDNYSNYQTASTCVLAIAQGGLTVSDKCSVWPSHGKTPLINADVIMTGVLNANYVTVQAGSTGDRVKLDTNGIDIIGKASGLTTRATEGGTIQCYVGADGKIYAGAGTVWLDSTGIGLKGANFNIYDIAGGAKTGMIHGNGDTLMLNGVRAKIDLDAGGFSTSFITANGQLVPGSGYYCTVGTSARKWPESHINKLILNNGCYIQAYGAGIGLYNASDALLASW